MGKEISPERLSQQTGSENAFGGYEKVNYGGGHFGMEPTED
jgi:hypothetical protein